MLTEKQAEVLGQTPIEVMRNLLIDITDHSGRPSISASTFVLWITPELRQAQPLDVFDYATRRLRSELEQRINDAARKART